MSNNGSEDEAKDIFQESIISFYENVLRDKFQGKSAISTYLFSIARFKWLNKIKQNQMIKGHENKASESLELDPTHVVTLIEKEKRQQVYGMLKKLGITCKDLLIDIIYNDHTPKELVESGRFGSEQVVRNQKSKCISKLRNLIKEEPEILKLIRGDE